MNILTRFIKKIFVKVTTGEISLSFAQGEFNRFITDDSLEPKIRTEWSVDEKVKHCTKEMSLEEKVDLLAGEETFAISSIERLGLSRVWSTDASSGIRTYGRSTAFPVFLALTSSWNRDLFKKVGETIAEECRAKGVSILLGPGINLYRVPTNGRNFEYMGEDPHLASELVVPYIQAVQKRGVVTTVKHFVANNSDYDRHRMDTIVDERTLNEIYYPAFKAAIHKGKSKGIMCAYNLLNGIRCSEHKDLLTTVLREQWGFDGFVISDWDCVYSTEGPMNAGLDLEMPYGRYYNLISITKALADGKIKLQDIDSKVTNLLGAFFEMGIYERPMKDGSALEFGGEHDTIALDAARESIVLLKNENNFLPLNPENEQKIVVMGRNAHPTPTSGGGSCYVPTFDTKSIYESLMTLASQKTDISLLKHRKNKFDATTQDTIKSADTIVLCVGFTHYEESEAWDRSWQLFQEQDDLIRKVSSLNKNVVVIINAGGGVETESWVHEIPALIHSFYLGQNAGQPVAEIIFGKINPSGKLPFTMAKQWGDFASTSNYVDKPDKTSLKQIRQVTKEKNRYYSAVTLDYKEGIMVGYRHFDTENVEPQFAFGHGLSYTSFEYSDLKLNTGKIKSGETLTISLKIKNTGPFLGKEVVQCYIRDLNCSLIRPDKELKGFEKITLQPNETKTVSFSIGNDELSFYDPAQHTWVAESGEFEAMIGSSSRDILLTQKFELIEKK